MFWQYVIIGVLSGISAYYIVKKVKGQFRSGSDSCAEGCGKCGAAKAFDNIPVK